MHLCAQSCSTLCNPMDCGPPGSSVHGILLARILEWIAMPSSRGSSQPRDRIHISFISCIGRWVLYHYHHLVSPPKSESVSHSVVSDSLGSSVHEILQARILQWVPFPSPGDLPDPGIDPRSPVAPALAAGFFSTTNKCF